MNVLRYAPWSFPFLLILACGSRDDESHGVDGGNGGSAAGGSSNGGANGGTGNVIPPAGTGGSAGSGIPTGPCMGLQCNQTTCVQGACTQMPCAAGTSTTVSGTVFAPNGTLPLYNVIVYVPNAPVPAFTEGAGCDRCGQNIVSPVTSTLTDETGRFVLPNAPVGENVPLVIQIGKWRRQLTIPSIPRCVDTPVAGGPEATSLPSNQTEGDIPRIAITTGGADSMECLPRRMGIEDSEITPESGTGRIHLFAGTDSGMSTATTAMSDGTPLTHSDTLWNSATRLGAYDIVILSCEGDSDENDRPQGSREAVGAYTDIGGRLFASHWHHRWISDGPDPMPDTGTWNDRDNPETPTTATINQSFPKGASLAEWLVNVNASTTVGQMQIIEARDNVQAVNTMYATEWMRVTNSNENDSPAIEYLSFNTPLTVAEEQKCGRVVYTDLHVSNATEMNVMGDNPGDPFPGHCASRELTPQEKAVVFMLFDLSSCIQDEDRPPEPPR